MQIFKQTKKEGERNGSDSAEKENKQEMRTIKTERRIKKE